MLSRAGADSEPSQRENALRQRSACGSKPRRERATPSTCPPSPIGATMTASTAEPTAFDAVRIVLKGRITAYTAAPMWRSALETLAGNPDRPVIIDASQVEY